MDKLPIMAGETVLDRQRMWAAGMWPWLKTDTAVTDARFLASNSTTTLFGLVPAGAHKIALPLTSVANV